MQKVFVPVSRLLPLPAFLPLCLH
ncbi:hypothetical protein Gohar_022374 [Gossypium harknessii]|uniref:Uncharacterized protein n=4 Tax=Gossypium TaxID=3633 RepID=A0A7J8YQZ8_GOSAI|nr:hypothetical protein [Gossypium lobatum]MBA0669569.1 hypothetical protein [Gossypium klotzschianum]MBA0701474.1 hypothetical protein [Gossypium aridum]MBA0818680.1 hypothetical protein [Gossypium harknessii]